MIPNDIRSKVKIQGLAKEILSNFLTCSLSKVFEITGVISIEVQPH